MQLSSEIPQICLADSNDSNVGNPPKHPSHVTKTFLQMLNAQKVQHLAVNIYKACRQQMLNNGKMASLSSKMETC